MRLLLPIIFLVFYACGQNSSKRLSEKELIQIDAVENIFIKKSLSDTDSFPLNEKQKKSFIEKWNNSESLGPYKYLPDYLIIISEKNGSIRKFRTNGDKIKEKDDWTFSIGDTSFITSLWSSNHTFPRPEDYNPITFIHAVSRNVEAESERIVLTMAMIDDFPVDWVRKEHIESLITMLDSKDTCGCFLNPLSSFIPTDFAEKGAYAAIFIKSYKDKQAVSFGLYACPKIDEKQNKELIDWWRKNKE